MSITLISSAFYLPAPLRPVLPFSGFFTHRNITPHSSYFHYSSYNIDRSLPSWDPSRHPRIADNPECPPGSFYRCIQVYKSHLSDYLKIRCLFSTRFNIIRRKIIFSSRVIFGCPVVWYKIALRISGSSTLYSFFAR